MLKQDPEIGTAAGHHSVINVPGVQTNIMYFSMQTPRAKKIGMHVRHASIKWNRRKRVDQTGPAYERRNSGAKVPMQFTQMLKKYKENFR
jgi:hypothetical protein